MPPAAPVRMMRLPDRFMLRFLLVQLFDGCLVKPPDRFALPAAFRGQLAGVGQGQLALPPFRRHVAPERGDENVLLAPGEMQEALLIEMPGVAGRPEFA